LGPREKLLGMAGLVFKIFFPKSENDFKCGFSRVEVGDFPSGNCEAKTSQTSTLEKAASKLFSNFGKKIYKAKRASPVTLASRGPVSATQFKVSARPVFPRGVRARPVYFFFFLARTRFCFHGSLLFLANSGAQIWGEGGALKPPSVLKLF
jgi:hypothetical protein